MFELAPRHRQCGCVHRIGKRDLVPIEARFLKAHFDLGTQIRPFEQPAITVDPPRSRKLDDAARGIAASLDLTAIAVPDPHPQVGGVAWFQDDQLVAAYAGAAVGDCPGKPRRNVERLISRIDDHEIIAEAMDHDENAVGTVVSVENYGAGDLLEIETEGGKRSLIPFKAGIADFEDDRILLDPEFLA